jgi:Spy/CpxP family protein refolding chaperone
MKRFVPIVLALCLVPVTAFAQAGKYDPTAALKKLGLNDDQVAQAVGIQKTTRSAIRSDLTHIRLVQAQIAEALLPANPDSQAITALIEKKGQLRIDIEKNRMSERLQLVKILGQDNYEKLVRFARQRRSQWFQGWRRGGQPGFQRAPRGEDAQTD